MNTIFRYIMTISIICGVLMLVDYHRSKKPQFKVGQCAKDSIHEKTRKVTQVRTWVYNYCLMRDNKCSEKQYSMRIKDFDRLMKLTKCPEAK